MNEIRTELREVIQSIKSYLEAERDSGVEGYYREFQVDSSSKFGHRNFKAEILRLEPQNDKKECHSERSEESNSDKEGLLKELHNKVSGCKDCRLYETRSNLVFGSGNPDAALMFIGEAPGKEEDAQGLPFVGDAGKMLTNIIAAMGYKREDVYIANCLKCRPPMNRSPLMDELIVCEPHLIEQIEIVKPKVICCLGRFAAQLLLKSTVAISKLRGKFYDYHGIRLMPTFHPAYLLRNPGDKRLVWDDMKKLKKELEK